MKVWTSFKKNKVKLDLSTDIDMLIMIERGLTGGIIHFIYRYAKPNKKYMKTMIKKRIVKSSI